MYFWKLNSTKSSRNQKIFHKNTWNEDAPPTAILFLELLFLIGIITRIIIIYRTPAVSGSGRNPGRNNSRKNVHSCRKILRPLKSSREQRQPHRRFKGIRLGQTCIRPDVKNFYREPGIILRIPHNALLRLGALSLPRKISNKFHFPYKSQVGYPTGLAVKYLSLRLRGLTLSIFMITI